MKIELSVPSKTFLVGEYAVLAGGRGLLLATTPRFRLMATRRSPGAEPARSPEFFHPQSPAGVWYQQSRVLLEDFDLEFEDPHLGQGGFGASGAQFTLLHALTSLIQSSFLRVTSMEDVLTDFQACDSSHSSGADVAAQRLGGVVEYQKSSKRAICHSWPFENLDFFILRTGVKLATFEHLQTLNEKKLTLIRAQSERAVDCFLEKNQAGFLQAMRDFQMGLEQQGLQAETTLELISRLRQAPGTVAAKGCGALGADTVLCLVEAALRDEFLEFLNAQGLNPSAKLEDLEQGLSYQRLD